MAPEDLPVGQQLRAARERQGLELAAIARSLHLPPKTLQAIEDGNTAALPADVYVRGFVKQYAAVLGLDPVPLLRAHDLERARRPAIPPLFPWTAPPRRGPRALSLLTPRTLSLAVFGLALALVVLYVLGQVRTYTRPPRLLILDPAQDLETAEPVLTVRGRTDPTAELLLNGERTLVREDGTFEESVGLQEGVNTLHFRARSIGRRETVAIREVLLREPPPAAAAAAGAPTGPFTLTVRAEGEAVWVALAVDGKTAFQGLLLPGSEQPVRGTTVTVTSGKAARTNVRVDGEERGALGETPGVLRAVRFTRDPRTGRVERQVSSSPAPLTP